MIYYPNYHHLYSRWFMMMNMFFSFFYDYVSFPITTYICRDSPIRLPFLEMVFLVTPPFSSGIFTPATFD